MFAYSVYQFLNESGLQTGLLLCDTGTAACRSAQSLLSLKDKLDAIC